MSGTKLVHPMIGKLELLLVRTRLVADVAAAAGIDAVEHCSREFEINHSARRKPLQDMGVSMEWYVSADGPSPYLAVALGFHHPPGAVHSTLNVTCRISDGLEPMWTVGWDTGGEPFAPGFWERFSTVILLQEFGVFLDFGDATSVEQDLSDDQAQETIRSMFDFYVSIP
jgi:hypothetical protein